MWNKQSPSSNPTPFRYLFSTASWVLGKHHLIILLIASIVQVLIASLDIVFLALISPFVASFSEKVSSSNRFNILGFFSISAKSTFILIVATVLIKNVFGLSLQKVTLRAFADREAEVGTALVQASLFERVDSSKSGHSSELLQTFTSVISNLFTILYKPLIGFIGDLSTLFAIVCGLLFLNLQVAIMAITYFSLCGFLMIRYVGRRQQQIGKDALIAGQASLRNFTEVRLMSRELRLSHKDQKALEIMNRNRLRITRLQASSTFITVIPRYLLELILISGIGLLVPFLRHFQHDRPILPTIALLVAAGYRILPSLNSVTLGIGNFRSSIASLQRIDSLGKRYNIRNSDFEFDQTTGAREQRPFKGDLFLENVHYRYPNSDRDVLADFNLVVKSGETVLIKGPSGSGKTTLIGLATGSLAPRIGQVVARSSDQDLVLDEKVTGISFLSQDVPLLDESFVYNICLAEPSENDLTRVHQVAQDAGLLPRILKSPMGFDTKIGENGSLLSAGERQRLGIARSLFSSPTLLILDEPTANLDAESERQIWETLTDLKGQFTILLVSHRVVPDEVYDKVIMMPQGSGQK